MKKFLIIIIIAIILWSLGYGYILFNEACQPYKVVYVDETPDISLHMDIVDPDKLVQSYYNTLKNFSVDEAVSFHADMVFYRDVAEQVGVCQVYDSARTIIEAFNTGSPLNIIENEANKIKKEFQL